MISININKKSVTYRKPVKLRQLFLDLKINYKKFIFAVKSNNKFLGIDDVINQDSVLFLYDNKNFESLQILRHSCAHLMCNAVYNLFPNVKSYIGPVVKDGFYYDFFYENKFSLEDLKLIELEMKKISAQSLDINKIYLPRKETLSLLSKKNEKYKIDIIHKIPKTEDISFYKQGNFSDLCRGPHVFNTSQIEFFKILNVSGAYWQDGNKKEVLQRIYATAWFSKKDLNFYLKSRDELKKRDHRKLGLKYNMFFIDKNNPGMIFWKNKGIKVYESIKNYMRKKINYKGYKEVKSPQVLNVEIWEKSGHWQTFRDEMFAVQGQEKNYAIKPMNCPCHINIYNQGIKSYKDLPLRLFEFGNCHRNEPSGSLHGLMRTRNFVQDDAHIFCMENQIQKEVILFNNLLFKVYKDFGFKEIFIKLSTRPENSIGSIFVWEKAQKSLKVALDNSNLKYDINIGEGAFYGPKIEYSLKDSLGRIWQCGTIQVDFVMPNKLNATYISKSGKKKTPVILHRAILGSIERFIGIIIENTSGKMPIWLSPIQVVILNINVNNIKYIKKIRNYFIEKNIRVKTDLRKENISFKIRSHIVNKIPYIIIIGDKEEQNNNLSVRIREKKHILNMTLSYFFAKVRDDIKSFK